VKVVLDTNVLVSGVFFGGTPRKVLEAWRDGRIQIVVSPGILDEYRRVGERLEARFPGVSLAPFVALLVAHADLIDAPGLPPGVTRDPDDDQLFACAVAAGCAHIISGDRDVIASSGYRGVQVLTPRRLLERLGQ